MNKESLWNSLKGMPGKQKLVAIGIMTMLAIGAFGAMGGFSDKNETGLISTIGKAVGLKKTESTKSEVLQPLNGTPKLSKEYVYAGSRMLATEDYGIASANPTPTPLIPGGGNGGNPTPTPTNTPTPTPTPPGTSASFLSFDSSTQGNWVGNYGGQGYSIVADSTSLPSWAQMTTANNLSYTWVASTAEGRALQKASNNNDRIAATWYTPQPYTIGSQFDINLNLTDGQTHKLALYTIDWDYQNRSETFEIVNTATGAVLDTRNVSSFSGGIYVNWNVSGNITIRVKNATAASAHALVSAIFLDTPPAPSNNSASFVSSDSNTQGNWVSNYGSQGHYLVNDGNSLPSYLQFSATGNNSYTWAASTSDTRALIKATNNNDRIAATWWSATQFDLNFNFTDGQTHYLTLHTMDWDSVNRSASFEVYDGTTNALLDTRTVTNFIGGRYLQWQVQGNIKIRAKNNLGATSNVVVGAFFVDNQASGGGTSGTPDPVTGCPSGFNSLGGVINSDPTTSVFGSNIYVFARGTDGAVYYQYSSGGSFSGWNSLGGIITSNPASTSDGTNLYVEGTGTDNNRYMQTTTDGYNFSGWLPGGVTTTTNPSAQFNGQTYTFVKGTGGSPHLCVKVQ